MVGDIISERWARSSRNGGRHHSGIEGGLLPESAPRFSTNPGAGTGRSRRNGGLAPPWHVRHVPPDLTPRTPGASTPAWIRLPRPKRAPCAGADALPRRRPPHQNPRLPHRNSNSRFTPVSSACVGGGAPIGIQSACCRIENQLDGCSETCHSRRAIS